MQGWAAIHEAALYGHTEVVALLVKRAAIDATTKDGWSALMLAAEAGKVGCVAVLLAAGANTEIKVTALISRALLWKQGHQILSFKFSLHRIDDVNQSVAYMLLQLIWNVIIVKDQRSGKTAIEHAEDANHLDVVALLKTAKKEL